MATIVSRRFIKRTGVILAIMIAASASVIACADTDNRSAMATLPARAVGALSVGNPALTAPPNARMKVVVFDAAGDDLGHLDGKSIAGPRVRTWERGLAVGMGNAVTSLTSNSTQSTPVDEVAVLGASSDSKTGQAMFWFNTGGEGGEYRSSFLVLNKGTPGRLRSVPGYMFSAALCQEGNWGITTPLSDFRFDTSDMRYALYDLAEDTPRKVTEWRESMHLRPATRTGVCVHSGRTLVLLYKNANPRDGRSLVVSQFDMSSRVRTATSVSLNGNSSEVLDGTLTTVGNVLYWVASDGQILSLDVDSTPSVRVVGRLPVTIVGVAKMKVSTTGTIVSLLETDGETPRYSEYEITTGVQTRGRIDLPWLNELLAEDSSTRVTNVAAIP